MVWCRFSLKIGSRCEMVTEKLPSISTQSEAKAMIERKYGGKVCGFTHFGNGQNPPSWWKEYNP